MFFMSTSTAQWGNNPGTVSTAASTTPDMFIECEYLASTTGAARVIKRSSTASDVNFTGSTAWQDISLTCQPSQSGILYLRGWYGKPKEGTTFSNQFYMDMTPVIQ